MDVHAIPNPKRSTVVNFPLERIKKSVTNITLENKKYQFTKSNEIFNQYTYAASEILSIGVYVDISLVHIDDNKTEITVEIRRKIGSFNKSYEVTNANEHIEKIFEAIANLTSKSEAEIDALKTNVLNTNVLNTSQATEDTRPFYKKKRFIIPAIAIALYFIITKYENTNQTNSSTNESVDTEYSTNHVNIPSDLSYEIIDETPNDYLSKVNINVQLNRKIDESELIALANKLHSSRNQYNKVWIFYYLEDNTSKAWATTHFTPNITTTILGSTIEEDKKMDKLLSEHTVGEIIGKWKEEQYTNASYLMYKNNDKIFLKTIYKNGQISEEQLSKKTIKNSVRYSYAEGGHNDEYFVINSKNNLELYTGDNSNFTTAIKR